MKKKFCIVAALVFVLSCLCLTACSEHEHSYAYGWSMDAEAHWHQPLCSDVAPEREAHDFIGDVCGTCGYQRGGTADSDLQTGNQTSGNQGSDSGNQGSTAGGSGQSSGDSGQSSESQGSGQTSQDPGTGNPSSGGPSTGGQSAGKVEFAENQTTNASGADLAILSVVRISSTFGGQQAYGSGSILSMDRDTYDTYIITNYHVVFEGSLATKIEVWLYGGERTNLTLSATFYGGVMDKDVAVLFIDGDATVQEDGGGSHTNRSVLEKSAARPITVGSSEALSVGDPVYVIGNAAGQGISVTGGVLSVPAEYMEMAALDATYNSYQPSRTIKILEMRVDAAINHGNSGGGLFNAKGEYVGTVNARNEQSGLLAFGYALPADMSVAIARSIIDNPNKKGKHGSFGFGVMTSDSYSIYEDGIARVREIVTVGSVSGTSQNVLQRNDEFVSYQINDGDVIPVIHAYQLEIGSYNLRENDTWKITVKRNGVEQTVTFGPLQASDFKEEAK